MPAIPPLYAILNVPAEATSVDDAAHRARRFLQAGISLVQIRAKTLEQASLEALIREVVHERDRLAPGTQILINDFPELVETTGADGAHVGVDDYEPHFRPMLGSSKLLGVSTHSLEDIALTNAWPIDYIGFGPVFSSSTKYGHAPITGVGMLRQASSRSTKPVVAIGGISSEEAEELYKAGAASLAVISDLEEAEDLQALCEHYGTAFERALNPRRQ